MANVIDIIIKGHDQTTKVLRKIKREAERAFNEAEQSFKRLDKEMRSIPDVVIDVDISKASAGITALQAQINQLERKDVEIEVKADTRLFAAGIAALGSSMTPVLATATAGVGALAASFAAAGAGAIAFAAVAIPAIGGVLEASKQIEEINKKIAEADTAKERAKAIKELERVMGDLTAKEKEALVALQDFKEFWSGFAADFKNPVLDAFIITLNTLRKVLFDLGPAFDASTKAMLGLMNNLNDAIESTQVQEFFAWLGKSAGPAITAFGTAFGNVMLGVMNLLMAFGPLTTSVNNGIVRMSKSFADWSARIENDSESFAKFIDYVRSNVPKITSIIKNLAKILGNLVVAFSPLGSAVLSVLNVVISGLKTFTDAIRNAFATGNFSAIPMAFIGLINNLLHAILSKLPSFIQAGLQMLTSLAQGVVQALPTLMAMVSTLITTILQMIVTNLPLLLTAGANILTTLIQGITQNLPLLTQIVLMLINTIITIITENLPLIIALGVTLLLRLIDGIVQMLPSLIPVAMQIIMQILNAIMQNLPQIIDAGIKILNSLVDGIVKMMPTLITTAVDLIVKIVEALSDHLPEIIDAGIEIVIALVKGLIKAIPDILSATFKIVNSIEEGIEKVDWFGVGKRVVSAIARGLRSVALRIPTPTMPKLGSLGTGIGVKWHARGGLFDGPTIAGLGEKGPEAIIPLSGPNMRPFARTIAKEMGGSRTTEEKQQNITININEAQTTTDREVLNALRRAGYLYG